MEKIKKINTVKTSKDKKTVIDDESRSTHSVKSKDKKTGVDSSKKIEKEKLREKEKINAKARELRRETQELHTEDVISILEQKTNQGRDKDLYDEYVHIFEQLQKSIRAFEKELRFNRSTRNVYALVALYSQQREVIADIKAISDYSENVERILSRIIQPLFNDITQSNLDIFYHIRKLVIETSKDDQTQYTLKRLEDLMREQGKYLQSKYENTNEKLIEIIADGK